MTMQFMQDEIRHVIFLMLENRSFDTVLGQIWSNTLTTRFPRHHIPGLRAREQQFYGLPDDAWLPDNANYYSGQGSWNKLPIKKNSEGYCHMPADDPGEAFPSVHKQIYGPFGNTNIPPEQRMRGFYINYQTDRVPGLGSGEDILYAFGQRKHNGQAVWDLNALSTLAENYAISDLWFSSVPTQTNPNRAFSIMGTSLGRISNNDDHGSGGYKLCGQPYTGHSTLFSVLNWQRKKNPNAPIPATWKLYADLKWDPNVIGWWEYHLLGEAGGQCAAATRGKYFTQYMFPNGTEDTGDNYGNITDFENDVRNDALKSFTYLEPVFFPQYKLEFSSYHPPGAPYYGEQFVKRIYDALRKNPKVFNKTLLVVTFDEHGGTYDHLYPPPAPPPDGHAHRNPDFTFDRYGIRVPTLFISPRIKPGTVIRPPYYPEGNQPGALPFDHTSLLKTVCDWLGIGTTSGSSFPLGQRTDVAPTFANVFSPDYTNPFNADIPITGCHDLYSRRRTSLLVRGGITQAITHITGFQPETEAHQAIVNDILDHCKTETDLQHYFEQLKAQNSAEKPS